MPEEVKIDSLSVAIEQSARDSSDSLLKLAQGLSQLKQSITGIRFATAIKGFTQLSVAINSFNTTGLTNLSSLADSMAKLSSAGKITTSIPRGLSTQIENFARATSGLTDTQIRHFNELTNALERLSKTQMPTISPSIGNQIRNIGEATRSIDVDKLSHLGLLADALKPLQTLEKSKLGSYVSQLRAIPNIAKELNSMDMEEFALSIARVADRLRPLADELEKVHKGMTALPNNIKKVVSSTNEFAQANKSANSSLTALYNNITFRSDSVTRMLQRMFNTAKVLAALNGIRNVLSSAASSYNDYIETLNLFNVAMGEYSQEAYDYAQTVSDALGVDPAQWMKIQATVMDMSNSFGVATDTAYAMSTALTQLSYDYSSLYNLDIEESSNKIRSALSGEIEPIRNLGRDLSVANLQLVATELGISNNVEAMTQAEKSMLRTLTLLRQSDSAMGDLSRTIEQPANQMRVLNAQLQLLSRSLGELIMPIIQAALPYVIAFVRVLREAIQALSAAFGIELPEFDFSSSTGSVGDYKDAVDEAVESTRELYQLSFDQLNILGKQQSASSTTGSGVDIDKLTGALMAEINSYDFLDEAMAEAETKVDKIAEDIRNWLTDGEDLETWAEDMKEDILGIGAELSGAYNTFQNIVSKVSEFLGLDWGSAKATFDSLISLLKNLATVYLIFKGVSLVNNLVKDATGAGILGNILKKLRGATDDVTDAFGKKNKSLTEQTKETAKETSAVGDMVRGLLDVPNAAKNASNSLVANPLAPVLDLALFGASLGALQSNTENVLDGLTNTVDLWESDLYDGASELLTSLEGLLKERQQPISNAASETANSIKDPFAIAYSAMEDDLNESLNNIETATNTTTDNLTTSFEEFAPMYSSAWNNLGINIGTSWSIRMDAMKQQTSGTTDFINTTMSEAGTSIQETWGAFMDGLGIKTGTVNQQIQDSFASTGTNIESEWDETMGDINLDTQNGLNSIINMADDYDEKIFNALVDPMIEADKEYAQIFNNMYNNFARLNEVMGGTTPDYNARSYESSQSPNYRPSRAPEGIKSEYFSGEVSNGTSSNKVNNNSNSINNNISKNPITSNESMENILSDAVDNAMLPLEIIAKIKELASGNNEVKLDDETLSELDKISQANRDSATAQATIEGILKGIASGLASFFGFSGSLFPALGFATGGFPENGVFYANSNELVGKFTNGKTAVANNAQIVEGIQQGVYLAVMRAMQNAPTGSQQSVIVLDGQVVGKTFGAAIERENRRSGTPTKVIISGGGY